MKKWLDNHKEIIVFFIYSCITFSLLLFHENWRDEAQAWLIARDCSIPELIAEMKYEGHFLLWYLILMPFAKLGFPYESTNVISWFICCISTWLILTKAPFRFSRKVLLIFTFPLLYLFPVVSRCYCLIPLATVLMSIFYKDRMEKPLRYLLSIVLLLNTHVIMAGMVGVVMLDYFFELTQRWETFSREAKREHLISIGLTIILFLISIYPLFGSLNTNKDLDIINNIEEWKSFNVFFSYPAMLLGEYIFLNSNVVIKNVILLIIIILFLFEIKSCPFDCFKIWLCITWQCLIYYLIFGPSFQKASTIIFIILYFQWISSYKILLNTRKTNAILKRIKDLCVLSLLMLNILSGCIYILFFELPMNYSNAFAVADYINKNLPVNSLILSGPKLDFTSSVIPYINKNIRFSHISGKHFFTYAIRNAENNADVSYEEFSKLRSYFKKNKELKLYYIYCLGKEVLFDGIGERIIIEQLKNEGVLKEIYCTNDKSIQSEDYLLYELKL